MSSSQYTSTSETGVALSNWYSTHSVLPFSGHQWKNESVPSRDERGSLWSFTARGLCPAGDEATLAREARVGRGWGRALVGRFGIQTTISPGPRLAHA